MEIVQRFQVRGLPGQVSRASFGGRIVDFWGPENPTHILVAHDGQNIFDKKSSSRRSTWKLAQNSIRVAQKLGITPPLIMGVFHSRSATDPDGRYKDLTPLKPFLNGATIAVETTFGLNEVRSDTYLSHISDEILPAISSLFKIKNDASNTAMLGSSMGGLMALYGVGERPDLYGTCLSFSPHWIVSDNSLVDFLIDGLPNPGKHKLWMSRGTKGHDANYGALQEYADHRAQKNGWNLGHDFSTRIYPRTGHNERSWQKYVADGIEFWLKN